MGRPWARGLLLLTACLGLCRPLGGLGASFYGESYVGLSMAEVSPELSLQFRFQTSKPQGLLFLAAGKTDYCLIELLSGTLQVKVKVGTGKQILLSEQRLRVDDLVWHSVGLQCGKDHVSLVIDKHHETTGQLAGGMRNFTFHHGIYVGGRGGLSVPYLDRKTPNFRGCMEDVVFNQREILTSLRSYPGFKKVNEVSLGCSDEFFAGKDEAISFFSSRSYVTFPEWKVYHGEGILRFAVQTETPQALLLFQSGRGRDFVALEIHEGQLKAHVGRGGTKTQLSSFSLVSDNKWHIVQLRVAGRHVDLMVDEHGERAGLPLQSQEFMSEGPLFVGGLNDRMWETAHSLELVSVPGKSIRGLSLKGCLQALEANLEKRALRDALVSRDVSAGCTSEGLRGTDPPVAGEDVLPPQPSPSTAAPNASSPLKNRSGRFLVLNKLEVQEGGRALLGQRHIEVGVDFMYLGINYSQILFNIQEMPMHGFLQIDVWPAQEMEQTFTLSDLRRGKVWYVHDGSEEPTDCFTFRVSSNSKKVVLSQLQDLVAHVFNIVVLPVNDPPYLRLPEGHLLLFENTKQRLTPGLMQVLDPDTDAQHLRFSVLNTFSSEAGFLESAKDPGKAISDFTDADLQDGNIFYVHRGHQNSRIVLRATDGELVSNTVVLRVMAVPWDFEVADRTGVVVPQGGTVLITGSNLSVKVNGGQHELDTRYDITHPPQFGQIQHLGSNGEWEPVRTFSQRSVDRGEIRYYSSFKELQQENVTDHFKFKVSIEGRVSKELLFPVTVEWLQLTLPKNIPLEISNINRKVLDSGHLQAAAGSVQVAERELFFKLLMPPKKGKLLLGDEVLKSGSMFSQKNVTDSMVSYKPQGRPWEHSQDSFSFSIVVKQVESKGHTFRINLEVDKTHITVTNTGLYVKEGEWTIITKSEFFVQTLDHRIFQYKVTKSPQHGELKLVSSSTSPGSESRATGFTDDDIVSERLIYAHDDSETRWDEFVILASATGLGQQGGVRSPDSEHVSTEIKVSISVELKNDEKPVRVVDKIFHVVRDSQRLLTLADLCYHDPDVDFDDGQLLYTRHGIPNGDLVKATDPTQKLYQFRQEDLREGRVLFKHNGPDSARFLLFVTDGVHYTSSLLEVSVSEAYIHIINNTGLLVHRGRDGFLTTANLSVTTNQDVRTDHEFEFHVVQPPKHGRLLVNNSAFHSFSQHDLKQGHVTYRYNGDGNSDIFNLTVTVKDTSLDVSVCVQVSSEDHQHYSPILHRESLTVEGKPVKLSRGKLQVAQESIDYVHNGSEEFDSLTILANSSELGKQSLPQTLFVTVESVNDEAPVVTANKVLQVWVNSVTEVTRGDLCAEDGDSSPQDLVYWVTPPSNGHLALRSIPGRSIQNFTQAQIDEGQLVFVHSGATSGGFSFQVTDGLNSAPRQIFSVTARALIISLEVNRGLSIFPGQ
ncbi:chondroitin sulfate proteoglycan 4B isoform X4 [Rattus norvegicus]|uniref:chondroitin sulfate proteoglycan 4B isoform X4 n=1 Tax=Rattus norvegicus TaxID=10116 RepID=UPI0019171CE9|nr:chondroitin sulfate proteoglycan 4B isoform X4 [Rattus norvegicus]